MDSATRHSCSNIMLAATRGVFPVGSHGGDVHTKSAPTKRRPRRPLRMIWASSVVRPPSSGEPVPMANAGSRASTSKVMYVGPSPTICNRRSKDTSECTETVDRRSASWTLLRMSTACEVVLARRAVRVGASHPKLYNGHIIRSFEAVSLQVSRCPFFLHRCSKRSSWHATPKTTSFETQVYKWLQQNIMRMVSQLLRNLLRKLGNRPTTGPSHRTGPHSKKVGPIRSSFLSLLPTFARTPLASRSFKGRAVPFPSSSEGLRPHSLKTEPRKSQLSTFSVSIIHSDSAFSRFFGPRPRSFNQPHLDNVLEP
jgi:hypothetical protein